MPKKTKKEKIIAQYRKRLKLLQQAQFTKSDQIDKASSFSKETLTIAEKKNKITDAKEITIENEENKDIKIYFFQDLKKSIFLSFLIIVLEISLYFVRIIK